MDKLGKAKSTKEASVWTKVSGKNCRRCRLRGSQGSITHTGTWLSGRTFLYLGQEAFENFKPGSDQI